MKCSLCQLQLDPTNVYVVCAFTPTTHVINLHGSCLRQLVGKRGWEEVTRELYLHGWEQLRIPIT